MRRLILSLCIISLASLARAADESNASQSAPPPLKISLTSQSTTYAFRDNIDLTLWSSGIACMNPQLNVTAPDGQPTANLGVRALTATLAEQLSQTPSNSNSTQQTPEAVLVIPDLKKYFSISKSGTYVVSFSAMQADPSGKLTIVQSDPLTIHVINESLYPIHEISLDAVRWGEIPKGAPNNLVAEGLRSARIAFRSYVLRRQLTAIDLFPCTRRNAQADLVAFASPVS